MSNSIETGGKSEPGYRRPFDLFILTLGHIIFLPVLVLLWLVIPLAVWLEDRGPVFFRQVRVGKNGREFTLLKFRTMVQGADTIRLWTAREDPRVTRVGRFLQRTGLDEIPQLISILKGDMSFVGPRALPVKMHEEFTEIEPRFPERLQVRPGATGLAHLYLPRHCGPKRRLKYDLEYIKRQSLWLDIKLMLWAALITLSARWGVGHRSAEADSVAETSSTKER